MGYPFIPPIYQFEDGDGHPLSGGKLYTYTAGTVTKTVTYSDADLTTANPNPIILNSRGEAPGGIFLVDDAEYKFVLTDANDAPVWTMDEIKSPIDVGWPITTEETSAGISSVNTSYAPGNVLRYGADNTGTNSAVDAVENAIKYANQRSGNVTVYFPNGIYNLQAGISVDITNNNVHLEGNGSRLLCKNGDIFTIGDPDFVSRPSRCGVRGFTFQYTDPFVDANAFPIRAYNAIYLTVENIDLNIAPRLMKLEGESSSVRTTNVSVRRIYGTTANAGVPLIHLKNCSTIHIDDCGLINTNVALQPNDTTTYSEALSTNQFMYIEGGLDTMVCRDVVSNRYNKGLVAGAGSGEAQINAKFIRCIFDYCGDAGVEVNNSGSMTNWVFRDVYIRASDGHGFYWNTDATGTTLNINVDNPYIVLSGTHAMHIVTTTEARCDDFVISGARTVGDNRLGAGGDGIKIDTARVQVRGGYVGASSSGLITVTGGPVQADNGIKISGTDRYWVTDVRADGVTKAYDIPTHASGQKERFVGRNAVIGGGNPEYSATLSTSIPSSASAYVNTTPHRLKIYIRATTGSYDDCTIVIDGATVSTKADFQCILEPGETITITYTSGMAWVVVPME